MEIFGFSQKETEDKSVAMAQHSRYQSVSFVMCIAGAKFKEHYFIIFLELFLIK